MSKKACVDCRFCKRPGAVYWCDHPEVQEFDPIHGMTAIQARQARSGKCGEDAKLFEPHKSVLDRIFASFPL